MDRPNSLTESVELQAGLYGKLPAHGDFVSRQLPAAFVQPWDQWLQQSISGSRSLLGDQWLDTYITSPIWHFAFSPGLLDEHAWLGIMSPSVDSVGRYFSLCIAMRLPTDASAVASLYASRAWFDALETLAIRALEDRLSADSIAGSLQPLQTTAIVCPPGSRPDYVPIQDCAGTDELNDPAFMLDYLISEKYPRFSYWRTRGSPGVTPCIRLGSGLPNAELFAQMMDSTWQQSAIK